MSISTHHRQRFEVLLNARAGYPRTMEKEATSKRSSFCILDNSKTV
ncbi:hypothetical protein ACLD43_11245 [Clostridium botulinum]